MLSHYVAPWFPPLFSLLMRYWLIWPLTQSAGITLKMPMQAAVWLGQEERAVGSGRPMPRELEPSQ